MCKHTGLPPSSCPCRPLCLVHPSSDVHLASFLLPSKVPSSERPSLTAWLERPLPPTHPTDLFSLIPRITLVSCLSHPLEWTFLSSGASAPSECVGGLRTVLRVFHSPPQGTHPPLSTLEEEGWGWGFMPWRTQNIASIF